MDLRKTDPELMSIIDHFAFDEVVYEEGFTLNTENRYLCILAALLGCQGIDEFKNGLPRALNDGVSAIAIREVVYQAIDYLGMGRVCPFVPAMNEIFLAHGYELPLENQSTTTPETRLQAGEDLQVILFGPQMKGRYKTSHISKWLADNCFGDYYTRTGLELKQREMITFCYLAAQGGVEPQLTAHAQANLKNGNDHAFMMSVISQMMPYIGYPRTLNAVTALNNAAESLK